MALTVPQMELGAATGLAGFALVQCHSMYQSQAPKLSELRLSDGASNANRQILLDADILIGGLAVLVGGTSALFSRRLSPLLLMVSGFVLISAYYHSVLNSPPPQGG